MWSSSVTGSEVLVDLSAILFFLTVNLDAGLEKSTKHQIYKLCIQKSRADAEVE